MQACSKPAAAFELAASIAASSAAAAAASEGQLAADHALRVGSASAAVLALPCTLPLLLGSPAWQRNSASSALLLQRLTAALLHLRSAEPAAGSVGEAACAWQGVVWQRLLCSCLLAVRHSMPADNWPLLASLL